MWMNQWEIDEAVEAVERRAPEHARFARYLRDWRDVVNSNSDGWAHWRGGSKAAERLMSLVQDLLKALRERGDVPDAVLFEKALQPIRAAATRHGLPAPTLEEAPDEAPRPFR